MEQQYFNEFLDQLHVELKAKSTIEGLKNSLSQFFAFFPEKNCKDIDISDLKKFILSQGKALKRSSLALRITHLKKYFIWLKKKGYLVNNIMDKVATPKTEEFPIDLISQRDLDKLDTKAKDIEMPLRCRVMYWLIRDTGLRGNEIGSILITDLNLREKLIYIRDSKGRVTKLVAFSKITERLIRQWMTDYPDNEGIYVFRSPNGGDYTRRHIYFDISLLFHKAFRGSWRKEAGPHIVRHLAATQWIANGGSLQGLKWMMGWKGYEQVERYVHQSPVMIKKMFKDAHKKREDIA